MVARFIVSHRLAGRNGAARTASRDAHANLSARIRSVADVVSGPLPANPTRGLTVIDADPRDMAARQREAHPDVIIEPEVCRKPARFAVSAALPAPASAGSGASFGITVRSPRGPAANASVELIFSNPQTGAT